MIKTSQISKPYTILAEVYDEVMKNVDYEVWADFIHEIISVHHPEAEMVLELACGTASLSFELEKRDNFEIIATDKSTKMLEKAQAKATTLKYDVKFEEADFLNLQINESFDVVFSVFDSVNYLQTEQEIVKMLEEAASVMKPNSIFIFDFTTPKNSLESIEYLNGRSGSTEDGFHYFRKSWYDADCQNHYNTFEIEKRADDGVTVLEYYTEKHCQRAYTLRQMKNIISKSGFAIEAAYTEFDLIEAVEKSSRITMVLRLNI